MYKRNAQGWSKHLDFIILDEIMLMVSFLLAMIIRHGSIRLNEEIYRNLMFVLALADIVAIIFFNLMHDVVKRTYVKELSASIKLAFVVFLIATGFMFSTQSGEAYSRLVVLYTAILHLGLGYSTRILLKYLLKKYNGLGRFRPEKRSMLVVVNTKEADHLIGRLLKNPVEAYRLVGITLSDSLSSDSERKEIKGVPVVADLDTVSDYICRNWVDSVYIDCPATDKGIEKLIIDCREMAVPVHCHIPGVSNHNQKQFVEKVGGTTVLTLSNNYATPIQLLMKRLMDIFGGLIGSLIALLIIAIVGPVIKRASPGPILYSSERIGQNGKRFKMIKIRSMVMNAEAKKKDLMNLNRVKDGMMFKLDWDPRIIGNIELPDGSKKTGIGEFIRKTSLDEFPQFFNVLKGEMSLVGTRPPTPDEWEKYEHHHRARLATKPGLTGMWQVNGRSEVMDFEEVVKLDTDYIQNWSMSLDFQILIKTVWVVLRGKGAM